MILKLSDENNTPIVKKKKRRWLLYIFIFFFLIISSIGITIYLLPRVEFLQRELANQVVKILNNELKGQLEVDKIIFHNYNDLELINSRLLVAGDTLAYIPQLKLKFRLRNLFTNDISVRYFKLYKPRIKLLRLQDSSWNYDHIVFETIDTDTSKSSAPPIFVRKLEIVDGKFFMFDSTDRNEVRKGLLNFSDLKVSKLNIIASAKLNLNDNEHDYDISKLSFNEKNSGIVLDEFYANQIKFRDKNTSLEKAFLKFQDTEITLSAEADNFSVINSDNFDLEKMDAKVSMNAKNFNSDLITHFSDTIITKNQQYDIEVFANGSLKNLIVNKLNVKGKGLNLNGSVHLKNILNPDSLRYIADLKQSTINVTYYKGKMFFDTEAIPDFGLIYFNRMEVDGGILDFYADYDIRSNLGDIIGISKLDINDIPKYDAEIEFKNIDLNKLAFIDQVSKLNGSLKIKGENFKTNLLTADLELKLSESSFIQENIDSLIFTTKINKGYLDIEELSLFKGFSSAKIDGEIDISNLDSISYDLIINSKKLNLSNFFDKLPDNITAKIEVKGQGIDIDNMQTNVNANLIDFSLFDNHILDYKFNLDINNNGTNKEIKFNSNELNFDVSGDFIFTDFIDVLMNEIDYSIFEINKIENQVLGTDLIDEPILLKKYPKLNFKLALEIFDIKKLQDLFEINVNTKGNIEFEMKSDSNYLDLSLNKFKLYDTYYEHDNEPISSKLLDVKFNFLKKIENDSIDIEKLNLIANTPNIYLFNNNLDSVDVNINLSEGVLKGVLLSKLNEKIKFNSFIDISKLNNNIKINIPKIELSINEELDFKNIDDWNFTIGNSILTFNDLKISNNSKEEINIDGNFGIKDEYFDNININLSNYEINNIIKLLELEEYLSTLNGSINNLNVNLDGYLVEPTINLDISGKDMKFNDVELGDLKVDLDFINHSFNGDISLLKKDNKFSLNVSKLPFNLNIADNVYSLVEDEQVKMTFLMDNIDAAVLEPFIPGILDIKGKLASRIDIVGSKLNGINYSGDFNLTKSSFLVEATNISYNADAKVNISNDLFEVEEASVRNKSSDLKNGKANLTGFLKMDGFDVDKFEFKINSKSLKVLRDETRYSMPDIFGDFIIATGKNPIVFSGNFDYPNISGDVDILDAKLQMPNELVSQIVESKLHYEFLDNVIKISLKDSTEEVNEVRKKIETPFLDLINYDMNIRFVGDFDIKMELNALTEMRINLGTPYKDDIVIFKKDRNKEEAEFLGEIILKSDSNLSFLGKKFETSGKVSFPTGLIYNPHLDILATYANYTQNGIPFEVQINVTGTKEEPKIKFSYIYNNQVVSGEKSEIEQNAFSLLTLNMLKEDALGDNSENTNLQGEVMNYGNSFVSSLASKSLNEALLEYGLNADIDLDLNNPDKSIVKLQGNIFKNIKWSVGGNVSNIDNNQITIEIPLDVYNAYLPYLLFSKPNNPFVIRENQIEWEAKLRWGKTW